MNTSMTIAVDLAKAVFEIAVADEIAQRHPMIMAQRSDLHRRRPGTMPAHQSRWQRLALGARILHEGQEQKTSSTSRIYERN